MEQNVCDPVIHETERWLDSYFAGEKPDPQMIPITFYGSEFQVRVWKLLLEIPYGKTVTYGALAHRVAKDMRKEKMSAQAVGGAVGKNPISVLVPCHRVIGINGNLTGYGGGIDNKIWLLKHEGIKTDIRRRP